MSEKKATASKSSPKKEKSDSGGSTSTTESKSSAPSEKSSAPSDKSSTPSEKSTKAVSAADQSPSYFSSVVTEDYRAGWDAIFGGAKSPKSRKPKTANNSPVTIELTMSDLDDDLRARLEDAFRAKAKQRRVSFEKHQKKARMDWHLACEFTPHS